MRLQWEYLTILHFTFYPLLQSISLKSSSETSFLFTLLQVAYKIDGREYLFTQNIENSSAVRFSKCILLGDKYALALIIYQTKSLPMRTSKEIVQWHSLVEYMYQHYLYHWTMWLFSSKINSVSLLCNILFYSNNIFFLTNLRKYFSKKTYLFALDLMSNEKQKFVETYLLNWEIRCDCQHFCVQTKKICIESILFTFIFYFCHHCHNEYEQTEKSVVWVSTTLFYSSILWQRGWCALVGINFVHIGTMRSRLPGEPMLFSTVLVGKIF